MYIDTVEAFKRMQDEMMNECYEAIRKHLTGYFFDDHIIVFNPQKHMISGNKVDHEFTWSFIDGAIAMFNELKGFNWISMDEEMDGDTYSITLELN